MPALSAELTALIRSGGVYRHTFVEIDHALGAVRVWDGIGEFLFGGQTWLGVGGLISVQNASGSSDLQNHAVTVRLQSVPAASMRDVEPSIRARSSRVVLAWIDPTGAVRGSQTIFRGRGGNLTTKLDEDSLILTATLRGPMADWAVIPRAYYTDADQKRRYAGDTGCSEVRRLENSVVTGWGQFTESSGEAIVWRGSYAVSTDAVQRPFGFDNHGLGIGAYAAGNPQNSLGFANVVPSGGTGATWTGVFEALPPAGVAPGTVRPGLPVTGLIIQASGANCYVDTDGLARSAAGLPLLATISGVVRQMRKARDIESDGTPTAVGIISRAARVRFPPNASDASVTLLSRADQAPVNGGFDNRFLVFADAIPAGIGQDPFQVPTLVEATTGTAVTVDGSSRLVCRGVQCVLSTTGVVLTDQGRRVLRSVSGVGQPAQFLRTWT
jgi:hypothetical protein